MGKYRYVSILFVAFFATSIYSAFDFSEADRLFDRRGESAEVRKKARGIYERALKTGNSDEKNKALFHLGMIAYYEGDLLLSKKETSKRKRIPGSPGLLLL